MSDRGIIVQQLCSTHTAGLAFPYPESEFLEKKNPNNIGGEVGWVRTASQPARDAAVECACSVCSWCTSEETHRPTQHNVKKALC